MTRPRLIGPSAPRMQVAWGLTALAVLIVLASFWREQATWWAVVATAVLGVGAARCGGWWPRHARALLLICMNVGLVFAYLWTLNERLHVVVHVTPAGYSALVGSNVLDAAARIQPGRPAVVFGDPLSYRVQATGEAFEPEVLSPLGQIGRLIRFATPKPAWTNVHITVHGHEVPESGSLYPLSGRVERNVREEWTSNGGAAALPPVLKPPYTISADLMRPDGEQGLILGLDQYGQGTYLQIRMDRPDFSWLTWSDGQPRQEIASISLRPDVYPMMQRDLRLLLACVIAALLLCGVACLFSLGAASLWPRSADRSLPLAGLLDRRGVIPLAVAVLALASLTATALIASGLLGSIPHVQDSIAYVFQARTLALGRLWVPTPHLPSFFKEDFIDMYHGRWFGKYPPGWPILLAIGERFGRAWLVNPVLSAVDLILVFLVGREAYGRPVGLIAAAFTLSSPFFLFLSGSFMAHTAALAYLAGFAFLLVRWTRLVEHRGNPRPAAYLLPSGLLLGMAFITRQADAVAFAAPFALLLLAPLVRRALPHALPWFAIGAAIPCVVLLAYNYALTGNAFTTPYAIWSPFDHLGFGPTTPYGHSPGQGLSNTSINLEMLLADLFGWPFYLTLALALVPFILGRATRWDTVFGLSTLSVMVLYVFYWGTGIMFGPRYYFVTLIWLALLSARGLVELYRIPGRIPGPRGDRPAALFCALLVSALLLYNLRWYLPTNVPIYNGYNFVSRGPLDAVSRSHLHHALVFTVSNPPYAWWSYGAVFAANSPLLDGDIVYARDRGQSDVRLMRQFPGRRYYRLEGTSLSQLHR